jgi:hypothetical protein
VDLLLQALGTLALSRTVNLPVALAPAEAACHSTVDEAAIAALKLAMTLPPEFEHGGAIYVRSGCFVFSAPVTNYKPMAVLFRIRTSGSSKLAGIYHTHTLSSGPCDHFSSDDVLQARSSRVPSFVGVHGLNHIRKLPAEQMPKGPVTISDRAVLGRSEVRGVVLLALPKPMPTPLTT